AAMQYPERLARTAVDWHPTDQVVRAEIGELDAEVADGTACAHLVGMVQVRTAVPDRSAHLPCTCRQALDRRWHVGDVLVVQAFDRGIDVGFRVLGACSPCFRLDVIN